MFNCTTAPVPDGCDNVMVGLDVNPEPWLVITMLVTCPVVEFTSA